MSLLSIKTRKRIAAISLGSFIIALAWVMQLAVVSKLEINGTQCSLPMTIIIVWGITFGSPLSEPTADELRLSTFKDVLLRQLLSGSIFGALVGAAFAALYSSVLPVYPIAYPLIGWISGYFCLRNFNKAIVLCIPLVVILTFTCESLTAAQMLAIGRPNVINNFLSIVVTESVLNALIAPFIFLPMRGWYEFARYRKMMEAR